MSFVALPLALSGLKTTQIAVDVTASAGSIPCRAKNAYPLLLRPMLSGTIDVAIKIDVAEVAT